MAQREKKTAAQNTDGRERELVAAAYTLISEVGLEGLRTRDIAARVGINIATLHYYFPSKEALVLAVVKHVNDMFKSFRSPVPEGATVIESMIQNSRHFRQIAPELQVVLMELGMRSVRDPVVADAMAKNQAEWRAWLEQQVEEGMARGILRADLDARATAAQLAALVMGTQVQLQVNARAFDPEVVLRAFEALIKPVGKGGEKKVATKKAAERTKVRSKASSRRDG